MENGPTEMVMNGIEILNLGIQILKIGTEIPDMGMQSNINLEAQNIGIQLQNIGMNLQNFRIQNQNMGIMDNQMLNFGMPLMNDPFENLNIMNIFNNIPEKKKNLIFETRSGQKKTIVIPYGTTVGEAIKKYFEINFEFLKDLNKDEIFFMYNAKKINERDKNKKVEDLFLLYINKIFVMYNELIGG